MASKIRQQIYIEPHQDHLLKMIAEQTGVSEAEILRQAIDVHIGNITPSLLAHTTKKYSSNNN